MHDRYVKLTDTDQDEWLYFDEISACKDERQLSSWWHRIDEIAEDIRIQLQVQREAGTIEAVWQSKAVKALTSYRQAQNIIERTLRFSNGELLARNVVMA